METLADIELLPLAICQNRKCKEIDDSITNLVNKYASINSPRVAVGLSNPDQEVLESLQKSKEYAELIIIAEKSYKYKEYNIETIYSKNPEKEIARMLAEDEVDGIVRGTVDGLKTYEHYKNISGESCTVVPSMMRDPSGRHFFITPISNSNGWERKERYQNAFNTAKFIEEWRMKPKIAVFSGIRRKITGEKKGLSREVIDLLNRTHKDAEWIAKKLKEEGYDAENWSIDLNLAVEEGATLIVPVNGMIGNQIFRTVLFCGGKPLAGPRLGLSRYYEDNSRTEKDFESHVKFLSARINKEIIV